MSEVRKRNLKEWVMAFQSGPHETRIKGGHSFWVKHTTALTYTEVPFSATLNTVVIQNDSAAATISLSWDGVALAGELKPGESITLNTNGKTSIWVKSGTASEFARLWGW
jgi:hypothetical protein